MGSGVARRSSLGRTDRDGPLFGAADEPELEGRRDRAERLEEVVAVRDVVAAGGDEEVTGLDAGLGGEAVVLDAADQDAGTLRQADRAAQPPGDVRGRDRDPEAEALRRLAAAEGIDPGAQRGIDRQGQVEALADAVRVQ